MKKSRIIVPALAMLTLSVAASVTGTVAWFTASRTASMSVENLAALNTTGNLEMSLTAGNTASGSSDLSNGTIKLHAMRDASYDVHHTGTPSSSVYYGQLSNDGNKITKVLEVAHSENNDLRFGTFNGIEVYYANYFTATFSTTSINANKLYFNNNISKSNVGSLTLTDSAINVYRSLRVSMEAKSMKSGTAEETKTIVWAPYTKDATIYNLCKAGTLLNPANADGTGEGTIIDKYKYDESNSLAIATEGTSVNVVKTSTKDPATVGEPTTTEGEKCLLSTMLKHSDTASEKIDVQVRFTIWFEGLDSNCVTSADELNTFSKSIFKTLNMSFYAIDTTLIA